MANESESREIQKREAETPAGTERVSARPVFVPPTDIFETKDSVVVIADLPIYDGGSLYSHMGEWLAIVCGLFLVIAIGAARFSKRALGNTLAPQKRTT